MKVMFGKSLSRFVVLFFAVISMFSLTIYSQDSDKTDLESIDDGRLIEMLATDKKDIANAAVAEILKRGAKLFDRLAAKKGDKRFFYGTLAKNPNFTVYTYIPAKSEKINKKMLAEGKLVTVEVAAIYLIESIFHESLDIAQSAYLTDFSLPENKQRAANTPKVIRKAWQAVEKWLEKLKSSDLNMLRKNNDSPLSDSPVWFS